MARSDYAFVFHCFALMFYVRTWMWHTTEAAAFLPGAQGFGWFFRWVRDWMVGASCVGQGLLGAPIGMEQCAVQCSMQQNLEHLLRATHSPAVTQRRISCLD